MRPPPHLHHTQIIARTRLFQVERMDLEFSNGVRVEYERLKSASRGAVLVVPMLDAHTVLLIREYAAGVHRYELALPKGRIEGEETFLAAANREMMEEVGYAAHRLRYLRAVTVAPGCFDHITHIVLAQDLYPCTALGDEPEEIETVPWRLNNIDALLEREDCTEARSLVALYLTRDLLNREEAERDPC